MFVKITFYSKQFIKEIFFFFFTTHRDHLKSLLVISTFSIKESRAVNRANLFMGWIIQHMSQYRKIHTIRQQFANPKTCIFFSETNPLKGYLANFFPQNLFYSSTSFTVLLFYNNNKEIL